jgi:hypothetical protein
MYSPKMYKITRLLETKELSAVRVSFRAAAQ